MMADNSAVAIKPRLRVIMFGAMEHEVTAFENEMQSTSETRVLDIVYVSAQLDKSTATLATGAKAVSLFATDHADAHILGTLHALGVQLITLRYAGVPSLDLAKASELGMRVAPAPAHAPTSIAEYTILLLLALNRKVHIATNRVRDGNMTMQGLVGFDLRGKTVGIIGTGKVGKIVVRILSSFGCKVLAFDMIESSEVIATGAKYVSMNTLLASSDIISLHAPLVPGTRHMIGSHTLPLCKMGVYIINTSRGALIDAKAAIGALRSGQIGGLALDAYEGEATLFFRDHTGVQTDVDFQLLRSMPNVLITGHQAALTTNALASVAKATLKTLFQFYHGEDLEYEIPTR